MIDLNDVVLPAHQGRYDLDAIVASLRDTAASWVPRHFPNGRREGDVWRLANIRGDAPRKNGSCVIALRGPHAGDWYDHDGGEGGGPLNALQHATGLVGRDLYAHAAAITGSTAAPPARRAPPPSAKEKDVAQEIAIILARAVPIAGTLAETYLRARGLDLPSCDDLRFHPDLVHWESRTGWPAMVAVIRDAKGETIGLHRIWLAPDGAGKASVKNNRKMLGRTSGGAVRLSAPADGLLGLAEGIETALAVMTACPDMPVWAALSAGNLEQIELPSGITRVIILADHDASGTGQRAAEAAAFRLHQQGCRVFIASPPQEGDDFNDLLCRAGAPAVRATVEAAAEWTPPAPARTDNHRPAVRSDAPIMAIWPCLQHRPARCFRSAMSRPGYSAWARRSPGLPATTTAGPWPSISPRIASSSRSPISSIGASAIAKAISYPHIRRRRSSRYCSLPPIPTCRCSPASWPHPSWAAQASSSPNAGIIRQPGCCTKDQRASSFRPSPSGRAQPTSRQRALCSSTIFSAIFPSPQRPSAPMRSPSCSCPSSAR